MDADIKTRLSIADPDAKQYLLTFKHILNNTNILSIYGDHGNKLPHPETKTISKLLNALIYITFIRDSSLIYIGTLDLI